MYVWSGLNFDKQHICKSEKRQEENQNIQIIPLIFFIILIEKEKKTEQGGILEVDMKL